MNNLNLNSETGTTQPEIFFSTSTQSTKRNKKDVHVLPTYKSLSLCDALNDKKDVAFNYKKVLGGLVAEKDVTIFWGPSGCGKSLFSYQLAEAIACGKNFFDMINEYDTTEKNYFKLINTLPAQKVLYVDFEMSTEQLCYRYSYKQKNGEHIIYNHNQNLHILKFDSRSVKDKTDYIHAIEQHLKTEGIKVVFIDNLSNISHRSEEADFAGGLMNELKDLQERNGLTLILVAHSNKINNTDRKSTSQMKGSSNFTNFADSVFCLSKSFKEQNIRYILQQKCRYGEVQFDENNVIEVELLKKENGNLGFCFNGYDKEDNMLREKEVTLKEAIKQLIDEKPDLTPYKLSQILFTNYGDNMQPKSFETKCKRYVDKIKLENE